MIPVLIDTAKTLKASQRRAFMAKTVKAMGRGGQLWAEAHLGWNRGTLRKALHELDSGMTCLDAFHCRRRKSAEEHLPGCSTTSGRSPMATARPTPSSRPTASSPASVPPRSDAS
jgi:hypothetical protein